MQDSGYPGLKGERGWEWASYGPGNILFLKARWQAPGAHSIIGL